MQKPIVLTPKNTGQNYMLPRADGSAHKAKLVVLTPKDSRNVIQTSSIWDLHARMVKEKEQGTSMSENKMPSGAGEYDINTPHGRKIGVRIATDCERYNIDAKKVEQEERRIRNAIPEMPRVLHLFDASGFMDMYVNFQNVSGIGDKAVKMALDSIARAVERGKDGEISIPVRIIRSNEKPKLREEEEYDLITGSERKVGIRIRMLQQEYYENTDVIGSERKKLAERMPTAENIKFTHEDGFLDLYLDSVGSYYVTVANTRSAIRKIADAMQKRLQDRYPKSV